jgi:hypothetical protein
MRTNSLILLGDRFKLLARSMRLSIVSSANSSFNSPAILSIVQPSDFACSKIPSSANCLYPLCEIPKTFATAGPDTNVLFIFINHGLDKSSESLKFHCSRVRITTPWITRSGVKNIPTRDVTTKSPHRGIRVGVGFDFKNDASMTH